MLAAPGCNRPGAFFLGGAADRRYSLTAGKYYSQIFAFPVYFILHL